MSVLITGAGLLGAQVAAKLVEKGETPVLYDIAYNTKYLSTIVDVSKVKTVVGDLLDFPLLMDTVQKNKIDRIIHTAALLNMTIKARPYTGVKVNVMGTLNVLEAAKLAGVKRVVFTSTQLVQSGAWNTVDPGPYQVDFTMKCLSQMPINIYAVTKMTSEYLGLSYQKFYGVDFAALRLTSLFGPWLGTPSGEPSQFIYAFVKDAAFGRPVALDDPIHYYPGIQTFVYSKDVARACVLAGFAKELKTRVYYICGDKAYSFDEAVEAIKRAFPKVSISVKKPQSGWKDTFAMTHPYDASLAEAEFGYKPDFDLEHAVRDYGDWLRRNSSG